MEWTAKRSAQRPETGEPPREEPGKGGLYAGALAGLGAVVALFCLRAYHVGTVNEDAYISLRYARNLLDGGGLVFNPGGEPVEGLTNLLWTLTVTAGSWSSGVPLTTVAPVLGTVCGVLTLAVAYRWCREELTASGFSGGAAAYTALAVPLLLTLAPGFAFYSSSGLEVPLFALLLTGGLYLLSRSGSLRRYALASLVLGAAALTRPEGALALVLGAVAAALRPGGGRLRRTLASALPGLLVLGVVTLWRLYYYGSPVPNTFFAKAGEAGVVEDWGMPYFEEAAESLWFHGAWVFALAGAVLGRGALSRNVAALALVPLWTVYVVYVGGDYMPLHRFFLPVLPVAYVLLVPGVALLARAVSEGIGFPRLVNLATVSLCALVVAFFVHTELPRHLEAEEQRKEDTVGWTAYRSSVAGWLDSQDPDALVAANAVGALGYYSETRILDMLGLNDAHIARHGEGDPGAPPGHQVGDAEYVLSREPDYIIFYGVKPEYRIGETSPYFVGDRQLAQTPEFERDYELIEVDLGDEGGITLFQRREEAG